jgi:hypothetical protein
VKRRAFLQEGLPRLSVLGQPPKATPRRPPCGALHRRVRAAADKAPYPPLRRPPRLRGFALYIRILCTSPTGTWGGKPSRRPASAHRLPSEPPSPAEPRIAHRPPTPGRPLAHPPLDPTSTAPATSGPTSHCEAGQSAQRTLPSLPSLAPCLAAGARQRAWDLPSGRRRAAGPAIAFHVRQSAQRTLPPAADRLIGLGRFVSFYAQAFEGLQPSDRHETAPPNSLCLPGLQPSSGRRRPAVPAECADAHCLPVLTC